MLPPYLKEPTLWVSTREAAERLRRSPETVRRWCNDGTLIAFGMAIYQDAGKRWWVRLDNGTRV